MNKLFHWAENHYPKWLSILRILLGLFLVYRGILFMMGVEKIQSLQGDIDSILYYVMLFHIVVFVHFVGGLFIALGLFTRWADGIQIPIIIGAFFLINDQVRSLISTGSVELVLSVVVLVFLVVFLIFGSGSYSLDAIKGKRKALI